MLTTNQKIVTLTVREMADKLGFSEYDVHMFYDPYDHKCLITLTLTEKQELRLEFK